ncbi:MAG: translation initiation factor IF-2 [Nocardioides sp.]|nr:translation initiation factor IF-2 [Nocardioides sp.]
MNDAGVPGLEPLAGGWSGETFLSDAGGVRQVVRIHARDPLRAEVDAALLRLVRGLLPVPEVLEVRAGDRDLDRPGLLVTSYVEGERGDLVLARLVADDDRDALATLGAALGHVAGVLAGVPHLRPGGLVGPGLAVELWPGLADGLPGWVEEHLPHLAGWTPEERAGLVDVAAHAQDLLDEVDRFTLVHSDLNPKNVLVDPDTLAVSAVLDWEFAHVGSPYTDLGNLLRFDRHPSYAAAVLDAWTSRHPGPARGDVLDRARAADLWALVDLAARAGSNPVADRAGGLLRAVAAARDLHAVPA